jgi:hypothetical protein
MAHFDKTTIDINELSQNMTFTFNLEGLRRFQLKLWIMKVVLKSLSWLLNFDIRVNE